MQDFSVAGGPPNVWGCQTFEGLNEIFYWAKPKNLGLFFKIWININKNLKNY